MNKKRKMYIESCEISTIKKLQLNRYPQVVAIEGKNKSLPVMIFLHGGPGFPIPFSVGCRGLFPEFTDHFIMVYWDQLGCGINNYMIDDHFKIDDFVKMTSDLVHNIKELFPNNKLYLFGMSWGSVLALKTAEIDSKNIDGVLTYGQVVTPPILSDDAFEAINNSKAPKKDKEFATNLKEHINESTPKENMRLSKIIRKYTDGYTNSHAKQASSIDVIRGMITSPDYHFKDFLAVMKNGYAKNRSLMNELFTINITSILNKIQISYYIFQGDTDIVTSTNFLKKILNDQNNPNIHLHILENSGHFPSEDATRIILEFMIKTCK